MLESQSFSGIYPTWKERGETLAVLLQRFRTERGMGEDIKLTYAGRLDPMAEGIVLILAGESRFEKDTLLGLSKTYEVDVLLGISTDTQDVLGLLTEVSLKDIDTHCIQEAVGKMHSITSLPYPMYSSVPVQGKPLFMYARAGTIVEIPEKKVTIYEASIISIEKYSIADLVTNAIADIQKVVGDFRQDESIKGWQQFQSSDERVSIAKISITASSGTYMRSLAHWIGEQLGVPALAYRIVRTEVGEYEIKKPPTL